MSDTNTVNEEVTTALKVGRDSASLIISRSDQRVLWVKRGSSAPFLGGYWAFPGGMLSQCDLHIASTDQSEVNHNNTFLRRAALRESSEELEVEFTVSEALLSRLEELGSWSTHAYLPKKVHCTFYSASCSDLEINPDTIETGACDEHPELDERRWLSGQEMYELWRRGEVTLAPPTLAICRALARNLPLTEAPKLSPELKTINQVQPWLQLIAIKSPTLPPATHTNAYLIGEKWMYVIDPGSSSMASLNPLFQQIDDRLNSGDHLKGVVLTHHHHDHVSGLSALLDRYKERQLSVFAHPKTADLLWKERPIERYTALEEGSVLVWERWDGGESRCELWYTPGHAPGHICLIHAESETAIVGDMVASVGTIIVDPSDGGDMGLYLDSLKRLERRQFRRLLPSHGAPIANPAQLLKGYIEHRQAREEKIFQSLPMLGNRQTRSTNDSNDNDCVGLIEWQRLSEIVQSAYDDAPSSAKTGKYGGLAGRAALSHLIHLQSKKRVLCSEPQPSLKSRWIRYHPAHDKLALSAVRLQQMMSTLREQCPWDRSQTLESLKRYLIEESYEVLDSLNDPVSHREELGDLFFQILFQAIIREQEGAFSLTDVFDTLASKLSRRHPHVFGDLKVEHPDEVRQIWAQVKASERAQKNQSQSNADSVTSDKQVESILVTVPKAAPALLKAQIIGEKVSSIGFDWPSIEGALAKVDEERLEVTEAIEKGDQTEITAEIGDLLFAIVNVCRHLKISPETALETTNHTFSERFKYVETLANLRGLDLKLLHIDEIEALWREAKSEVMRRRRSEK